MFGIKLGSPFEHLNGRGAIRYASLREGAASPTSDDTIYEKPDFMRSKPKHAVKIWLLLLLLATNFATFFGLVYIKVWSQPQRTSSPPYVPDSWARIDALPETYERLNWWTEYSDKNATQSDALWDDINPAHGFIAMDREWALSQHWPRSMHLPSDDSKNVYLLEAYHLIHCTTIIHKTFWEAIRGADKYSFNPPHAGHCIDMLRQYIMCKADNTPLYIFGDDTAGDEQYRKCNDWNTLRQFATDHSACYRDTPPDVDQSTFPLGAHFGYCDGGYDNLTLGERRGNWQHGAVFDGGQ